MTLIWVVILLPVLISGEDYPPVSICPGVFDYERTPFGVWLGVVSIISNGYFAKLELQLNMTVAIYHPEAKVGSITVIGDEKEIDKIATQAGLRNRQMIKFAVPFPTADVIPKLKMLRVNGRDLCPPSNAEVYYPGGEITFGYTLTTNLLKKIEDGFLSPQNTYDMKSTPASEIRESPRAEVDYTRSETTSGYTFATNLRGKSGGGFSTQNTYNMEHTTFPSPQVKRFGITQECGVSRIREKNFLIVRGQETVEGQWPWQAALYKQTYSGGLDFICGGSLVTGSHIITAAHCLVRRGKVEKKESITIFLGKHNLRDWGEETQQSISIKQITVHPDYDGQNRPGYDLAIIEVIRTFAYTDFVRPVCLWDKPINHRLYTDNPGTVVGWGKDENGRYAQDLKQAKMPIVSEDTCRRSDPFFTTVTSDTTFCAGYRNGTTVCNGDSGGGIFFKLYDPKLRKKTWHMRGIVSVSMKKEDFGEIDCDAGAFVVFTDVAKLMPWILERLGDNIYTRSQRNNQMAIPTPRSGGFKCGLATSGPNSLPLILSGQSTYKGQWPWHAAIYKHSLSKQLPKYICGGSLISPTAMITAAHCFKTNKDPKVYRIFFGKYHLSDSNEDATIQNRGIKKMIIHPSYTPSDSSVADIAILTFYPPVEFTEYIRPVCLWDRSIDKMDYTRGTVVGWGFDETEEATEDLMMATMPIVSYETCIKSNPTFYSLALKDTNYCAGYLNGTSVCNGDSGGGMVFPIKGSDGIQWHLRGIVSFSMFRLGERYALPVCDPKNYVMFTDVSKYLPWINARIKEYVL